MLTREQEHVLWHLGNFSVAEKDICLMFLSAGNREKPEYGLRTLKRWGYVVQRKDGLYGITAKGLAYIDRDRGWLMCGGNQEARRRLAKTSRVAALLAQRNIYPSHAVPKDDRATFIPSQIWRTIREGITSTARFNGMLFFSGKRLVVYHIGDGNMDWQMFGERSLFFHNYGKYDDRATGMLLICDNGIGPEVAENIIRNTISRRKRLLSNPGGGFYETNKPQRYARSPIRLHDQYSRAFLTEEQDIASTLHYIKIEDSIVQEYARIFGGTVASSKCFWDTENYPKRVVLNTANDLLKYLYLFAYIKDSQLNSGIEWDMVMRKKYEPIAERYREQIWVMLA